MNNPSHEALADLKHRYSLFYSLLRNFKGPHPILKIEEFKDDTSDLDIIADIQVTESHLKVTILDENKEFSLTFAVNLDTNFAYIPIYLFDRLSDRLKECNNIKDYFFFIKILGEINNGECISYNEVASNKKVSYFLIPFAYEAGMYDILSPHKELQCLVQDIVKDFESASVTSLSEIEKEIINMEISYFAESFLEEANLYEGLELLRSSLVLEEGLCFYMSIESIMSCSCKIPSLVDLFHHNNFSELFSFKKLDGETFLVLPFQSLTHWCSFLSIFNMESFNIKVLQPEVLIFKDVSFRDILEQYRDALVESITNPDLLIPVLFEISQKEKD